MTGAGLSKIKGSYSLSPLNSSLPANSWYLKMHERRRADLVRHAEDLHDAAQRPKVTGQASVLRVQHLGRHVPAEPSEKARRTVRLCLRTARCRQMSCAAPRRGKSKRFL